MNKIKLNKNFQWIFLGVVSFFFFGCASQEVKPREVDMQKSCQALSYELQATQQKISLNVSKEQTSTIRDKSMVTTGVIISVAPPFLLSPYWYVAPSLTIWYYNMFIVNNQEFEYKQYLQKRVLILEQLIKNRCKK